MAFESPARYVSIPNIKYEEVLLILKGLDELSGAADDMTTLSNIDALQKKIKLILEGSKVPFRA